MFKWHTTTRIWIVTQYTSLTVVVLRRSSLVPVRRSCHVPCTCASQPRSQRAQLLNVKHRHARLNRSERRAATGVATRSGFIAFCRVALPPLSVFGRSAQFPVVPGVSGVASTVKLVWKGSLIILSQICPCVTLTKNSAFGPSRVPCRCKNVHANIK